MTAAARTRDDALLRAVAARPITVQTMIRSTQMSLLLNQDLARAHLDQRLAEAERQRLAHYVVRVAKARRQANRARRQAERAQLRLRLLAS